MGIRSKKSPSDINNNHVMLKMGNNTTVAQDLLSLTIWDSEDKEYSIKSLLEKIFEQEAEINALQTNLKTLTEVVATNEKAITDAYEHLENIVIDNDANDKAQDKRLDSLEVKTKLL
jgi:hypothetical protein